ncbi:MAG: AMP-binding protein [Lachnospiraceae bacterium]|nr:AMP-binding protein [Lachnospiraceae bacterium]
MKNILELMEENAVTYADRYVLADENVPKGMTYRQVYTLAGRVYAYLKAAGIGKEDFVMLCLPRGVQFVVAVAGVLRAGAAYVIVEDTYAPERIAYIKADCGCKLVIDEAVWSEIQTCQPLEGYEPYDEHAACFAVYTSGSTGNPKGVLHEYGNVGRILASIEANDGEKPILTEDMRFGLAAPLNFVASSVIMLACLANGLYLNVVSYAVVKNPMLLVMLLMKNKINTVFLTPSYVRKMTKKPPMLRSCIVGSEPADGIFLEGLDIHNAYTMSEAGFLVAHFYLDKRYDATPAGKPSFDLKLQLLDEEGREVPPGEEGEICFDNPFVRGYINLPEQTAEVFKDGLYHTGDLGRFDENGRLVVCGRLNDMVKINGNRVEPGEIEGVARKVLGVDWAAARIFDDGRKTFICVYYLDNIKVDEDKVRKEMEQYLPYYMIPSFFMHIDKIPVKQTGKMDRRALPAPSFDDYLLDYEAPTNEVEEALCHGFEKVLEIEKIGINDDFYQLGGDSMATIELITCAELPGLTATDIFKGRTPKVIAALYTEHGADTEDADAINEEALKTAHPLTTEQIYMVDYQFYTPDSTMYNLYNMLKIDKSIIDMSRLTEAANKALRQHPALSTVFYFDENGDIRQRYVPECFEEVTLEKVSEAELEEIKKTLVKPFRIFKSRLYRLRIFETETAGYLFMDVHHTVFDGTSSKVFFGNLLKAYAEADMDKDYYYYMLDKRERQQNSDFYQECHDYFTGRYDNVDWVRHLTVDHEVRENTIDNIVVQLPISGEELDRFEDRYKITRNGFFITAAAIATAIMEQKSNIMMSWIHNGRDSMAELSSVGLLYRDLPVGIQLTQKTTMADLFADVAEQINGGILHSCYPYVENGSSVVLGDVACVLYQDDLRSLDDMPGLLGEVELPDEKAASQAVMDVEILNTEDGLMMAAHYAASRYNPETMERYRRTFCATIDALLEHLEDDDVIIRELARDISHNAGEGGFLSRNWWLTWMRKK